MLDGDKDAVFLKGGACEDAKLANVLQDSPILCTEKMLHCIESEHLVQGHGATDPKLIIWRYR